MLASMLRSLVVAVALAVSACSAAPAGALEVQTATRSESLSAARLAAASGIGVLVTSADLVDEALGGGEIGTWFQPNPEPAAPAATGPVRTAVDRLGR